MQANTIHGDRIFTNSITAGKIQAGAIGTSELAADSVTADKIAASEVTAAKISVTNLAAISANIGNITSGDGLSVAGNQMVHLGNFSNSIPTVRIPHTGARAHLPTIYRANLTAGTTGDNSSSSIGESMRLQSTGTGGTNHGLRGQNTSRQVFGLVGVDTSFNVDFFGEGFGKIYVANGVAHLQEYIKYL